jgi:hypothetical protein
VRGGRLAGAAALAVLLLASTAACKSSAEPQAAPRTTTTSTSATPSPTPTPTPTPTPAPVLWPLTGVVSSGPVDRPALAVKIENSIDARPQTGLNAADMVWEQVVEGGITRYVAVFQSTVPAQIGPVRSVRPMDPAIAAPLHGLLAYSGGQQLFLNMVAQSGVQALSMDAGVPGFFRAGSRPAPHNVYANPQQLIDQADAAHKAAPPAQFAFAPPGQQPSTAVAGTLANVLSLTLSGIGHPQWTWSPADGKFLRSEGSTPAVTADAGRIAATNVVVLRVNLVMLDAFDAAGNRVPETVLTGSGEAVVASAGKAIPATWSKGAVGDVMSLVDSAGQPVRLAPGNTWIELVPNGTGAVTIG